MTPYLHIFTSMAQKLSSEKAFSTQEFHVDPNRLKSQMVYFAITAQIVNVALEFVVPYMKRIVSKKVEEAQANRANQDKDKVPIPDAPEEEAFLERARDEAKLDIYDVAVDYREMVVQFGYLSLFSAIWPLTPLSFLVNNWVELRSDAMKIATASQRPIPWRADSIGPWLNALGFLSWLGSLVSPAIVFLFNGDSKGPGGDPSNVHLAGLLVTILFAEHIYLAAQYVVRYALSQIDSPGLQKERAERFLMRKQLLEETLGPNAMKVAVPPTPKTGEKITLAALEEEARRLSTSGGGTPEQT